MLLLGGAPAQGQSQPQISYSHIRRGKFHREAVALLARGNAGISATPNAIRVKSKFNKAGFCHHRYGIGHAVQILELSCRVGNERLRKD